MSIAPTPRSAAELVRASSIISSFHHVCEELILNALDAGCNNVYIVASADQLCLDVEDDGIGISPEDLQDFTGTWSATSKSGPVLKYGFRGEAIAAIRLLSTTTITSKVSDCCSVYTKIFAAGGPLVGFHELPSTSQRRFAGSLVSGTRVSVKDLFDRLPARRKSIKANSEVAHIKEFVQRMSVLHHNIGWKLTDASSGKVLLNLVPHRSVSARFSYFHDQRFLCSMQEVSSSYGQYEISGLLSQPRSECCSISKEQQYFYLNSRWLRNRDAVSLLIDKVYVSVLAGAKSGGPAAKHFAPGGPQTPCHPCFILNLCCPADSYDVLSEPDKSLAVFRDYEGVVECVKLLLLDTFRPLAQELGPDIMKSICDICDQRVAKVMMDQRGVKAKGVSAVTSLAAVVAVAATTDSDQSADAPAPGGDTPSEGSEDRRNVLYSVYQQTGSHATANHYHTGAMTGRFEEQRKVFKSAFLETPSTSTSTSVGVDNMHSATGFKKLPDSPLEGNSLLYEFHSMDSNEESQPLVPISNDVHSRTVLAVNVMRPPSASDRVDQELSEEGDLYSTTIATELKPATETAPGWHVPSIGYQDYFQHDDDTDFAPADLRDCSNTYRDASSQYQYQYQHDHQYFLPPTEFPDTPHYKYDPDPIYHEEHHRDSEKTSDSPEVVPSVDFGLSRFRCDDTPASSITGNAANASPSVESSPFDYAFFSTSPGADFNPGDVRDTSTYPTVPSYTGYNELGGQKLFVRHTMEGSEVALQSVANKKEQRLSNTHKSNEDVLQLLQQKFGVKRGIESSSPSSSDADFAAPTAKKITQLNEFEHHLTYADQVEAGATVTVPTALNLNVDMLECADVVGQVDTKFILIRSGDVLMAVDQHAADERVKLEKLTVSSLLSIDNNNSNKDDDNTGNIRDGESTSNTESPLIGNYKSKITGVQSVNGVLRINNVQAQTLSTHSALFEGWGFRFKVKRDVIQYVDPEHGDAGGVHEVHLTHVPVIYGEPLTSHDFLEYLLEISSQKLIWSVPISVLKPPCVSRIAASKACRSAVRFGDRLTQVQSTELVSELSRTSLPFQCAHGRPSVVPLLQVSGYATKRPGKPNFSNVLRFLKS